MALIDWRCRLHLLPFQHHQGSLLIQYHTMLARGKLSRLTDPVRLIKRVMRLCVKSVIMNGLKLLIRLNARSLKLLEHKWSV